MAERLSHDRFPCIFFEHLLDAALHLRCPEMPPTLPTRAVRAVGHAPQRAQRVQVQRCHKVDTFRAFQRIQSCDCPRRSDGGMCMWLRVLRGLA